MTVVRSILCFFFVLAPTVGYSAELAVPVPNKTELACVTAMIQLGQRGALELTRREDQEYNKNLIVKTLAIQYPVLFSKAFERAVREVFAGLNIDIAQYQEKETTPVFEGELVDLIWKRLLTEYLTMLVSGGDNLATRLSKAQSNLQKAKSLGMTVTELEVVEKEMLTIQNDPALKGALISVLQQKLPDYLSILASRVQSQKALVKIAQPYKSKSEVRKLGFKVAKRTGISVGVGLVAWLVTQSDLSFEVAAFAPIVYEAMRATYGFGESQYFRVKAKIGDWRFRRTAEDLSQPPLQARPVARLAAQTLDSPGLNVTREQIQALSPTIDPNNLESIMRFGSPITHLVAMETRMYSVTVEALKESIPHQQLSSVLGQLKEQAQETATDGSLAKGRVYDLLFNTVSAYHDFLLQNSNMLSTIKSDTNVASVKLTEFIDQAATQWTSFRKTEQGSDDAMVKGSNPMFYLHGRMEDLQMSLNLSNDLLGLIKVAETSLVSKARFCEQIKKHLIASLQDRGRTRFSSNEIQGLISDIENLDLDLDNPLLEMKGDRCMKLYEIGFVKYWKLIFANLLVFLTVSGFASQNTSDPVTSQRDLNILSRWEEILQSTKDGKVPWYHSMESFVVLKYDKSDTDASNFFDYIVQSLPKKRSDMVRQRCSFGCRLEVSVGKVAEMLSLVQRYKKEAEIWDYNRIFTCSTFSRADANSFQARHIYQAISKAIEDCSSRKNSNDQVVADKEQCEANVDCDWDEFGKPLYECATFSRTNSFAVNTRNIELGREIVAEDCSALKNSNDQVVTDKEECVRNSQCKQIRSMH